MKTIKLPFSNKGKLGFAIIDEQDSHLLDMSWHMNARGFIHAALPRNGQPQRKVGLHHAVLGKPPKGMHVDHISRDRLDNRRTNLRLVTPSQNSRNKGLLSTNKTGFKGVSLDRGKFRACLQIAGKSVKLGTFKTAKEASSAYERRAKEVYGEFACTT